MQWIRALAPALVAGCTAVVSLSAIGQSMPAAGVRQKVDVRAMAPGLQASDAVAAEARPAASGLTRDQRKEATLQARQDGALQPAGEAANERVDKPAAALAGPMRVPPATAEAAPATEVAAEEASATVVAAAPPPAAKKSARKKARAAAASAPV